MGLIDYPLTVRSIISGIALGTIFSFIAIYLYLKIGIVAMGGTFLLGYLILSLTGKYDSKENAIIITITGATTLVSMGFIDPIASLFLYSDYLSTVIRPSLIMIIAIALSGSLLGLFVLYPMYSEFIKLKWPMVTPMAYIVKILEKEGAKELNYAIKGMAFSSAVSSILLLTDYYQVDLTQLNTRNRAKSSFTSINLSPLFSSLGFFISYLGYAILLIGVIYSFAVWFIIEKANPLIHIQDHFFNPYIYSVAIPMMITTAILTLIEYSKGLSKSIFSAKNERSFSKIPTIASLIALPVTSYILLSLTGHLTNELINEIIEVVVIAIPITFISSIFAVRSAGETGFSSSFTLDATLIITLLLVSVSLEAIFLAFAIISVFESTAISLIRRIKFGEIIGVDPSKILKAVLIGCFTGSIIGPFLFWSINNYQGGIGSNMWPAPFSKLLGGYVLLFYVGLKKHKLPPMVKPELLIISVILTIILWLIFKKLKLKNLSPILIAVGMIIPPSYLWIGSIGALIDYYLFKKYRGDPEIYKLKRSSWNALLAGIMSGEGIVIFIMTLISIIPILLSFL